MKLVYIFLVLVLLKSILLYKVYQSVPAHELKRRARAKDKRAANLYKVAAYGSQMNLLLWALGTISAATLEIWSARTSWWLAVIVIVVTGIVALCVPPLSIYGLAGSFAGILAGYQAKALSFMHPVLGRLSDWLPQVGHLYIHTGIYEKKDFLDLINQQNHQPDNRIPESDLEIAFGALTYGDRLVREVMTPRRQVKFVSAGDSIGPLLMDELHKSGHSRFPVVKDSSKGAQPQIIGTLYLNDLIGYDGKGKVKELARRETHFINEDATLRQALAAFLKTHHHLFIVVNSFEEIVGVVSLEDVLEQIIGKAIVDEFDNDEDLRGVAAKEAKTEKKKHEEVQRGENK